MRVLVITVSTRARAGAYQDLSGPAAVEALHDAGFEVTGPRVVSDGAPVESALRDAIAEGFDVVVTSGGTGLAPDDQTPERTRSVLDREVPGVAEALRAAGISAGIATAMLSRGIAGVAGRTFVVNLPGSVGGVRDGVSVLAPVLRHVVDQIRGGDH